MGRKNERVLFKTLALILILILSFSGCKKSTNWEQTSDETKMSIYCALVKEYMLLVEDLGEDTPYPAMNRNVKGNMLSGGMTQQEALDRAEQVLIEEQAVFWRGEQEGIQSTDDQVAAYIRENVLEELKAMETYDQVDAICHEEGITYEDTIWAYAASYKMEYIAKASGVTNEEEFAAYKEEAVTAYKKSAEYADFQKILDNCRSLIEDDVTDKETLKNADIYW